MENKGQYWLPFIKNRSFYHGKKATKTQKNTSPQRIEHQPVEPSNWKDDKPRVDATMMSSQHHPGWFPWPPPKKCVVKIGWLKRNPSPRSRKGGEESQHFAGCLIRKSHMFFWEIIILFVLRLVPKNEGKRGKGKGLFVSVWHQPLSLLLSKTLGFADVRRTLLESALVAFCTRTCKQNQALPNSRRLVLISHINVTFQFHFRIWLRYSCYCLSSATASHWGPL